MYICSTCGAKLTEIGPDGLCPRCFLQEGLAEEAGAGKPRDGVPGGEPSGTGEFPPAGSTFPAARRFGDYELLEEIARGGMGVVYKARQPGLNRIVAVKMMLAGPWASANFVRRFHAEAQAAASLQHPNIVAIHQVGEHEGQPFFSMDYVEGRNLAELTRGNPLPARRAALYLKSIAEAVHYAHQRGILHRDLKPSNILIDSFDQPRITDFGLAKRFSAEATAAEAQPEMELTLTGQVLGSPSYLPPEQAEGRAREVTPASDVYALGAVLYHLLTGRPPFQAEKITDLLQQVSHTDPVGPRLLNLSVPKDLETICLKCLEKEIARRYPSAAALAEELGRFLDGQPVLARPVGLGGKAWRWCRRQPVRAGLLAALCMVFALGLAGILWQWQRAEHERRTQQLHAYTSDMTAAQAALRRNNRGMALDLVRRHLPQPGAEDLRGLEWRYLWQQTQSGELQQFSHPTTVHCAALSPDGKFVATASLDLKVRVWDVVSSRQLQEYEVDKSAELYQSVAFSPDGKWLVAPGKKGIVIRQTTDWSVVRELTAAAAPLCLSPDGKSLAAAATNALRVWNLHDGSYRELTNLNVHYHTLAFTPDGRRLTYCPAVPVFARTGQIQLWDFTQGTQTPVGDEGMAVGLAISSDGKWLAAGTWEGQVCLYDLATQRLTEKVQAHRGPILGVAFSPDGKLLATAGHDQLIHLWEAATLVKLGTHHGHLSGIWSLAYASDGQKLLSGSADGTARLWPARPRPAQGEPFVLPTNSLPIGSLADGSVLVAVNAKTRLTQLLSLPNGQLIRSWPWDLDRKECPDFQFFVENNLAVGVTTNGVAHFYNLTTGAHLRSGQLGTTGLMPWHLSPDNRWLVGAYSDGSLALCDLQTAGRFLKLPHSFSCGVAFSPDSRRLAYANPPPTYAITILDLASRRELATLPGYRWYVLGLRFSPDGRLLASGGVDGDIRLWSAKAGQLLLPPLKGHSSRIQTLLFSADGKTLISAGADRTVRWWNVVTGREMLLFEDVLLPAQHEDFFSGRMGLQANWQPGSRLLLWQERQGMIQASPLPTLAEIDASERGTPR